MSREGARRESEVPKAGTPIWVWVVYALGIFAATILAGSILFTVGALFLTDEGDEFYGNASPLGFAVWGGLMVLALGLWIWRRRQGRR